MKTLLDSSVFLEVALNQPGSKKAGKHVQDAIDGKTSAVVSAVCLLEVKYKVLRERGEENAIRSVEAIKMIPGIEIIPATSDICEAAASLKHKYYTKERQISNADVIHLATAITAGCGKIITGDPDFKDIEEMEAEIY